MKKVISMTIYEPIYIERELKNMLERLRFELTYIDRYFVNANCFKFEMGEEVFNKLSSNAREHFSVYLDTDLKRCGFILGIPFEVIDEQIFSTNSVQLIYDDRGMSLKSSLNNIYGIKSLKEKVEIKKVIFNGPCTIVFWSDGDKTIVKCDSEDFDKEKGLAMAICKRFLGTNKSKSNYNDIFKKWCHEDYFIDAMNSPVKNDKKKIKKYSVKEYSKKFGKNESTVRKMCREKMLNAIKPNNEKWIILLEED